ncbi:toxin-activating lysine-acyltransferase [Ahrensia sp. R2A130]|uniref:toxin-activating lysine-acyltransferase n=1 Tax=Ahrensia sp. R2A130 TaxID=744979 RepID=UPI0001E09CAA|nr:toxin-activating lysine-acyltransferase [Ahrensia sp. R2A130]EFL88193.1 RzcC [Ahrensia sp. R2A130]
MTSTKNSKPSGESATDDNSGGEQPSPEVMEKIAKLRSHVRESFGKIAMAMMMLPRYRNQSIADLQHLVLEPLIRDRIAMAYPGKADDATGDMVGFAIWASVSDEVDAKIREQIEAGTFPVRLSGEEWVSGENNWLLDIVAPSEQAATAVLSNFGQLTSSGNLKLHPAVARTIDRETIERLGAQKL